MKNILALLFASLSGMLFAQDYEVVYQMEIVDVPTNYTTYLKTYLEGNGQESLYEEDFEGSRTQATQEGTQLSINENWIFYKDLKKRTCSYPDHIKFKSFDVIDTLPAIEWRIGEETKVIAGYKCQKAIGVHRGRTFEVFFTKDIPVSDGPWKLLGLPGMILEVQSDDAIAAFRIRAEKVTFANTKKKYNNPHSGKKAMSFEKFREIYRQKYQEFLYKIVTPDGETRPLSKGFREYLVE